MDASLGEMKSILNYTDLSLAIGVGDRKKQSELFQLLQKSFEFNYQVYFETIHVRVFLYVLKPF